MTPDVDPVQLSRVFLDERRVAILFRQRVCREGRDVAWNISHARAADPWIRIETGDPLETAESHIHGRCRQWYLGRYCPC